MQRVTIGVRHRGGYLSAGRSFSWNWHRGDEATGSIGVKVHSSESLTLQYMIGSGDERRDSSQLIRLIPTACKYGGLRTWFACPVCHKRVRVLCMRAARFACGHSQRVAYSSQYCDVLDRMCRKQAKLEVRLGEHWARPKGMRQHTYKGLMKTLFDLEERRDNAFADFAARLFG